MPRVSLCAVQASLEAKKFPHHVDDSAFFEVPNRLRASIARLRTARAVWTNLGAGRAEASEGRQGAVAGIRQRDPGIDANVVSVASGSGKDRSRQNADVLA